MANEAAVIEADVAIIGGGLIGAATAIALADQGLTAAVCDPVPLEAAMAADFDGRAYAVAAASRRMLERLGLWSDIAPEAQPIADILVSDGRPGEKAAPFFLRFDSAEAGPGGFGHMLEDHVLRRAMLMRLMNEPLATHLPGVSARVADASGARAALSLSDGRQLRAALVVACDGRRSKAAAAAGIDRSGWDYDQVGLVCAVAHERPHHGVAHEFFLPSGPFAILPLTGDRSALVWTERADRAEALRSVSDAFYTAEIRRRFGDFLGQVDLIGKRWAYPLSVTVARSFTGPRLALAGDAARGIHPIAGQGMNYGLRDAAALAEVAGMGANRGEDIGAPDVLTRYERWRRPDSVAIAAATDGLNRLFSNDLAPIRLARDLGLKAFGSVAPLRRAAMKFAAGDRPDLPAIMRA